MTENEDVRSEIDRLLKGTFGHDEFLPGQREVMGAVLAGRSAAAIFPTGFGKSLCYQLPAKAMDGTVLVVSPLKALMKDQVDAMQKLGVQAARLDSSLAFFEASAVLDAFTNGRLDILYVAPERFGTDRFRAALEQAPISLLAIDEAHCISEWGHDFRPEYLRLGNHVRAHKLHDVLCLTATATKKVEADLCTAFAIDQGDR